MLGQKASDVLENGIHMESREKIFLNYNNSKLLFDTSKSLQDPTDPTNYTTLPDSMIFLVTKNGVNIYLQPLNPLNFGYNKKNEIIIDPINEVAATVQGTIINLLVTTIPPQAGVQQAIVLPSIDDNFEKLRLRIDSLQSKLIDSKKDTIVVNFKKLKALNFLEEASTKKGLVKIKSSITKLENHFELAVDTITKIKNDIKEYNGSYPEPFMAKYIFNTILKDLSVTLEEQKKRLVNLQNSYNLVLQAQQTASIGAGVDGLRWCLVLDEVPSHEGKISIYTVTIIESGYKLSDKEEIVNIESKDILKRTIRVRQFQRFVPEVSVGTAFTFLEYNSYGTTSDSTGQQFIGSPTENTLKNLNITTMINFNYYIPNSPIHPLYQIGVGINSGLPTILTGFGLRSSINGINRLAIAGGVAMAWIKELDELKVGDKINGTDDIDKDYKYSSSPKFSPYIALQFNF